MPTKTDLRKKKALIVRLEKEIEKFRKKERAIKDRWAKGYQTYKKKNNIYRGLKNVLTKKAEQLRVWLEDWEQHKTVSLTIQRDKAREEIENKQNQLEKEMRERDVMLAEIQAELRANDEVVNTIFSLNETIVHALEQRDSFASKHVYNRLVDDKGNMRSQLTIDSSDGLRRVVALVNSITKVKPELAEEALSKIDVFFDRFSSEAEIDSKVKPFYDLTRQVLITRNQFRIGPDLYKFLSMNVPDSFPELQEAQKLLGKSLRSEKTDSYLRLYQRESTNEKWLPVPKS